MLRAEGINQDRKDEERKIEELAAANSISPEEYERWLPPAVAIKMLEPILSEASAKEEIYSRLCGGEIECVARTANWHHQRSVEIKDFGRLGSFIWQLNKPRAFELIWRTGTHKLGRPLHPSSSTQFPVECFGIRFNPEGVSAVLRDSGVGLSVAESSETHKPKKPLSHADAETFAKAIIAGWPQASQDWAHEKLALFYPDHTIGREAFRRIFRAIQGPKTRGKAAKQT